MAERELCLLERTFTLLGLLLAGYVLLKQLVSVLRGLKNHIVSGWWRTSLTQYGRWAVVTGATDGIGKAYARELAKRGLDVVLISRTLEKLKKVAAEIEQESGRKTRVMQVDFTNGSHIYQKIKEELNGLEIGILVNNVGMKISEEPTRYLDISDLDQMLDKTINCNILSVLWMTRTILPQMLQRKKGLIINLASEVGNRPYPLSLVYSASKVFVDFFSRGLHEEYKSKGITVQSVMPLLVSTDMTYKIKTNIFVKSPEEFASEALDTVGYTNRTSGCLSHSLQSYAIDLIPDSIFHFLLTADSVEKSFNSLKKDYIKNKKEK
ncbi:PREDICTED: very-long-chain 3-oxoacyl-CoA reductase-like [Nanorana parkeri]|uniref:very-long-chain 3-oxoacyl-CoA reductase-like n=1 Tax=Nanorana parkeri TaxID=125878 RepID=UPI000854B2AD|nr:PREDICTED: very-long-chain 3-oxoacyl-CoA reductase-like [Nanorana parkeri]